MAVTLERSVPGGVIRSSVPIAALAFGLATLWLLSRWGPVHQTYAASSPVAAVADLAAGLGLLGAGAFAWLAWRRPMVGLLTVLAGMAWFGSDWLGWTAGPPVLRSLGLVLAPFLAPLLSHVVLAITGHDTRPRVRNTLVVLYLAMAILVVRWVATYQPYHFRSCWPVCESNALVVSFAWDDAARILRTGWLIVSGLAGVSLALWTMLTFLRSSRPLRRRDGAVMLPAIAVGLTIGATAVALLLRAAESSDELLLTIARSVGTPEPLITFGQAFVTRAVAVSALAVGIAWVVARARTRATEIRRLAVGLRDAPGPGSVQDALSRTVGDPTLTVWYWLPGGDRCVDASCAEVDSAPARTNRITTTIEREGERGAAITHDPAADSIDLRDQLGPAARVAIDNERLQAAVLAQLRELQASRARIVESGDATRRALERDLHDGVQQRLLALAYDLRVARLEAERAGVARLADTLRTAEGRLSTPSRRCASWLTGSIRRSSPGPASLPRSPASRPMPVSQSSSSPCPSRDTQRPRRPPRIKSSWKA